MFSRALLRSVATTTRAVFGRAATKDVVRAFEKNAVRGGGVLLGASLFGFGGGSAPKVEETPILKKGDIKNFDIVVRETDALYENYLIDNAYAILRKFGSCDNSELLWRLARVLCEKGKLSKEWEERKKYMLEAMAVVEKALAHEPEGGSFGAHKWYAILLDYVGEIEGNKSRIAKSYDVKKHLERALQINPNDATTWHILGVWHYSFADMPGYTRMVAKAIFGTPPSSTYEQALEHFKKAETIQAGFYSTNLLYIGETLEKMGDKEGAIENYKKAFKMPVLTADDQTVHTKAHEKLRKAGIKDHELLAR